MTYDHWKSTNPADEFLGPEPNMTEVEYQDSLYQIADWIKQGMISKEEGIQRSFILEYARHHGTKSAALDDMFPDSGQR